MSSAVPKALDGWPSMLTYENIAGEELYSIFHFYLGKAIWAKVFFCVLWHCRVLSLL